MAQRRNSNQANEPRPSRLRVLVTESYVTNDGEEKTAYHQVGTAFFHKNGHGLNIEFIEGISVSGQVVCLPPPASAGGVDKARQPLPGAAATEGDHHLVVPFTFPGCPPSDRINSPILLARRKPHLQLAEGNRAPECTKPR